MKTLILTIMLPTIAVCGVPLAEAPKNPDPHEAKVVAAEKAGIIKIRRIAHAILNYQTKNGRFPRTLADLVTDKHLVPADIFMQQADKGLISPVYYPDSESSPDPRNTPLLAYRSKAHGRGIVARVDGSVVFEKN